ncbi:unnamed protein product, partial [marine sediment metagenome]
MENKKITKKTKSGKDEKKHHITLDELGAQVEKIAV